MLVQSLYYLAAKVICGIHAVLILMNTLAIPFAMYYQPWYIWVPIVTVLVSPLLGHHYCIFNQLEDHYRVQAGLEPKHRGES